MKLILVALLVLSGCKHFPFFHDAVDCTKEAGKNIELIPTVRRILESPVPATVETELAKLVIKFGHDLIACLVARVGSDAEHAIQASPPGTAHPTAVLVQDNAKRWLGAHQ